MTISDEQLVRAVRDDVAARSGAGAPLDEVLRAGRQRVARRRAVGGAVLGVLAVVAVAGTVVGFPLITSAPPAAPPPSVTLTPDPTRTSALRPAVDMYDVGRAAAERAGLGEVPSWYAGVGEVRVNDEVSLGQGRSVSGAGAGFGLSVLHLDTPLEPGATGCDAVAFPGSSCEREPQDDGSVLFALAFEGEFIEYVLVTRSDLVRVQAQQPFDIEAGQPTGAPAAPEELRPLVLDPTLRW